MDRPASTHSVAFPQATFRPADGATELAIAEAATYGATRPERVTALLATAYSTLAGETATVELARRFCSGGREWLLQCAADRYRPGVDWFVSRCSSCGEPYDLAMSLASGQHEPAGAGFPVVEVQTCLGPRRFEAPNGAHEEALARLVEDPARKLVGLCGLADEAAEEAELFSRQDIERIDQALELASPEVADSAVSSCPVCGDETTARLDPLRFAFPVEQDLIREVHLLASAYSWSEKEILSLSPMRRSTYAALIAGQPRRPSVQG